MSEAEVVRAAGGLVRRRGRKGHTEVLLVHRPRYDDWSLPKGKAEPGESDEDCARREVEEETGYTVALGAPVGDIDYIDAGGRPKRVRYWQMMIVDSTDTFAPNDEVDVREWVRLDEASKRLTYAHDRGLLAAVPELTPEPIQVYLVRHAKAGSRGRFEGPDTERPLSGNGRTQADGLAKRLGAERIVRVLSSPYLRCAETVTPLAASVGVNVELDDRLAEGADVGPVLELLAAIGAPVVLCSHGDVLGDVLHAVNRRGVELDSDRIEKGSTWELTIDGGEITRARYEPPPT